MKRPSATAGAPRWYSRYLAAKEPIPRALSIPLGVASFGLVIAIWALFAYTGVAPALGFPNLHNPFFLPSPGTVAKTLYNISGHVKGKEFPYPFDSDSPFWVFPIAVAFARALGIEDPCSMSSLLRSGGE